MFRAARRPIPAQNQGPKNDAPTRQKTSQKPAPKTSAETSQKPRPRRPTQPAPPSPKQRTKPQPQHPNQAPTQQPTRNNTARSSAPEKRDKPPGQVFLAARRARAARKTRPETKNTPFFHRKNGKTPIFKISASRHQKPRTKTLTGQQPRAARQRREKKFQKIFRRRGGARARNAPRREYARAEASHRATKRQRLNFLSERASRNSSSTLKRARHQYLARLRTLLKSRKEKL